MNEHINQVFHTALANLTRIHCTTSPPAKSPEQESCEYDSLPSIEDVSVYLAEARELLTNLTWLKKEYPRFFMGAAVDWADRLVNELEQAIGRLED